jgi:threonine/homoserine efflux transporter RhtA
VIRDLGLICCVILRRLWRQDLAQKKWQLGVLFLFVAVRAVLRLVFFLSLKVLDQDVLFELVNHCSFALLASRHVEELVAYAKALLQLLLCIDFDGHSLCEARYDHGCIFLGSFVFALEVCHDLR